MAHDLPDHKLSARSNNELEVSDHASQRAVTEKYPRAPPPGRTDWTVRNTRCGRVVPLKQSGTTLILTAPINMGKRHSLELSGRDMKEL